MYCSLFHQNVDFVVAEYANMGGDLSGFDRQRPSGAGVLVLDGRVVIRKSGYQL